ncbi:hypothetical protein ERJ75_001661600 [Trypanosoma vivax]|uniref:Uncharacterized protein n=1 Tax=Trypanosoma vivax (strain Y486) TaxID=1055687 RepID=G0U8E9_TRYVY|nr:hypothetical protein ERJ75_001661600 [Trypanosoma vivax]CCC53873.1 conserved hypothetical protein [Trypanosoma vivax Y486]
MAAPVKQARFATTEPCTVANNNDGSSGFVGSNAVGVADGQNEQPVDMFVAYFEAALDEELRERKIATTFRDCFEKMSSPYSFIRTEGLCLALQWLCDVTVGSGEEAMASNGSGGSASAPHMPYDAIRSSVMATGRGNAQEDGPAANAKSCQSELWNRVQRALRGAQYITSVFHCVLVPRLEGGGRPCYSSWGPLHVELSEEEALMWSTLRHAQPLSSMKALFTCESSKEKRKPLNVALTEVTYHEQELALRLLQGLSLTVYDQRKEIARGRLIPFAIEVWQCCLQHIKALYSQHRRHATTNRVHKVANLSGTVSPNELGKAAVTTSENDSPVHLECGLETVVIATIDAVEALCHYNPLALTRIVQQNGVPSLLELGLLPYAPRDIRCAVFDTISVLMQEVAPFRCAVAAGAAGIAAARVDEDKLMHTMVQNAMSDTTNSKCGAPLPYLMDRASASKFDSAVREWFSQHGLSHVVSAVMELRDVRGTPIAASTIQKNEAARIIQREGQLRERKLHALLEAVDGRRAAL